MKLKYLVPVALVITIVACNKNPMQVDDPGNPSGDVAAVKLKDMNERLLPSPHYHFGYNDSGYITQAVYSGGQAIYDVDYSGKKILDMRNNIGANKDRLEYEYNNDEAVVINVINKNNVTYRKCFLTYTNTHQLQKLEWDVKQDAGFVPEQTLQFSYYTDGNLMELVNHAYPVGPQTEATITDRFENYDDKINADGFSLLHTDPHHLILLPSVKLQVNNPRRNIRTGDGLTYEINYTYTYDTSNRPLIKTGDVLFTNGQSSGQHFESQVTFAYY